MRLRLTLALLLTASAAVAGLALADAARAAEIAGRTPLPAIERAAQGEPCIAASAVMRRDHMEMLKHQRDATVHGGVRGAKASLKACIGCHASVQTGSVAKAETNFCVSCHTYAAVKIDCFECHASRPAALAQRGSK